MYPILYKMHYIRIYIFKSNRLVASSSALMANLFYEIRM